MNLVFELSKVNSVRLSQWSKIKPLDYYDFNANNPKNWNQFQRNSPNTDTSYACTMYVAKKECPNQENMERHRVILSFSTDFSLQPLDSERAYGESAVYKNQTK